MPLVSPISLTPASTLKHGILLAALAWLASSLWAFPRASAETSLKKGDRLVFLGDSITQAGDGPGGYVVLVREAIAAKQKDLGVEVIGAGISGNRVPDLENRLERDVLSKKPTVVIIYIGINDVWHSLQGHGTPKDEFNQGLRRIIKRLNEVGSRVVVCTPSVIGEKHDGSNQLDAMLEEYSEISRKVAADTGSGLIDLRKQFISFLKEKNTLNASKDVLTGDGVHLNAAGNRFVADRMLETLENAGKSSRQLRHVVLFKFKDGTTPADVEKIVSAFRFWPSKIDSIADFEWGTDVSPENRAQGYTHCFLVTFRDEKGRDAYLPHPAHKEFGQIVGPHLDKVLVVDFWSRS